MKTRSILVWSERPEVVAQLVAGARVMAEAAGWEVALLQLGAFPVGEAGPPGGRAEADLVYRASGAFDQPERVVLAVCAAAEAASASLIVTGATKLDLEVAPRVAERLGAGYAAWTVELGVDATGSVTARCTTYAGSAISTVVFKPGLVVAAVADSGFATLTEAGAGRGSIDAGSAPAAPRERRVTDLEIPEVHSASVVLRSRPKPTTSGLDHAQVVVDVGQGVQERTDLVMIGELAAMLGATIACSRPVAADRDWFPEWLGLSGAKIRPDLCVTIGISGAVQHLVGIRGSRVIAAVNSDASAAIFSQADVGVVADLYQFIPALIERLQARRIAPAAGR